jgi:hypothetical protein
MVGSENLDAEAVRIRLEVFDGHARGLDRTGPRDVGVEAGLVVQHADTKGRQRIGLRNGQAAKQHRQREYTLHGRSSIDMNGLRLFLSVRRRCRA